MILSIIIICIGFYFLLKGIRLFFSALKYLFLAAFVRVKADEKTSDEMYRNKILAKTDEYKKFQKDFDKNIGNMLDNRPQRPFKL